MFKKFVHIGAPTDKKMPNEEYCEDMKVWISDPEKDEFKFEYLRFEKILGWLKRFRLKHILQLR